MRLYVAIRVPEGAQHGLAIASDLLKERITRQGVRFTANERMHVTLRFLGAVEPDQLSAIDNAIASNCASLSPVLLSAKGVQCFPNPARPAVVVSHVAGDLQSAYRAVATATGLSSEQASDSHFLPHITLARVSPPSQRVGRALGPLLDECADREWANWRATELLLMETLPGGQNQTRGTYRLGA